ncbi:MAG TPA: metallophosphoesterase family protein [Desulfobacteria bacterium]|nr:metallophosphoesterase family protein [Desulfobacteria bacterium]
MIIGIFSDAHGDIGALEQAIQALDQAQKLIFLGDVHEFTPEVSLCIDELRANKVIAVKGNCDRHAVIGDTNGIYRAWLAGLPEEYRENGLLFMHQPLDSGYLFNRDDIQVCFCGHTHRSFVITPNERRQLIPGETVTFAAAGKYLVGIGSISRPRGGEAKVVALYDTVKRELRLQGL